jgi:hypothetical protein
VRPWARLRLAHALLKEALNRFRERAQAPMVAAASTYFSHMTGGRYERPEVDEEGETPVLRAVQADGVRKGIEAMSDGTSDQLCLALRLAAPDLRRASHPQMPLILDDVLITSDDERSANILRALARFAEAGLVMIFTHHRHLIDVARTALGDQGLMVHNLWAAPMAANSCVVTVFLRSRRNEAAGDASRSSFDREEPAVYTWSDCRGGGASVSIPAHPKVASMRRRPQNLPFQ